MVIWLQMVKKWIVRTIAKIYGRGACHSISILGKFQCTSLLNTPFPVVFNACPLHLLLVLVNNSFSLSTNYIDKLSTNYRLTSKNNLPIISLTKSNAIIKGSTTRSDEDPIQFNEVIRSC